MKNLAVCLWVLAAAKLLQLSSFLQAGGPAFPARVADPRASSLIWGALLVELITLGLILATISGLRRRLAWSLVATAAIALTYLPTYLFPVSLVIGWQLLPDPQRDWLRAEASALMSRKIRSLLPPLLFLCAGTAAGPAAAAEAGAARVSITQFSQEVMHLYSGCESYQYASQDQLRTEMEKELTAQGVRVLYRREIRKLHEDEYQLPNLDAASVPKRGKFLSAQYTLTGGITELGICEERSGSSLRLGGVLSILGGPEGVDVGGSTRRSVSKVKLVANLVAVETGEVLRSFTAYAEVRSEGYEVEGGYAGIGGSHQARSRPMIERATNQAIQDLARQISGHLGQARKG